MLYYKEVGTSKSDDELKKAALKYGNKPHELYPKLTAKYKVDAAELANRLKQMQKVLARYFLKVKEKKSSDDVKKLVRKYVKKPKELYDKLNAKYGKPVQQ
jgi:hypothetical protein